MTWTRRHAQALTAFFAALDRAGIPWMVLRNYEGLPDQNRGKDVDLLLAKADFPAAASCLETSLGRLGFSRVDKTRFQYVWCFTFFDPDSETPSSIKIDLLDGFVWRGAQVVDFPALFFAKVRYNSFFVPDPAHDGFMLWIKPLMTGGFVKDKYRKDILHVLSTQPEHFRELLGSAFGQRLADRLWPLLEAGRLDATIPYQRAMCRAAWWHAFRNRPSSTLQASAEHFYRELVRRSHRPKASMLAVVGPDGAGKTTFLNLLHLELARVFVKDREAIRILHFRPGLLPNLKKLFGGRSYDESKEAFTSPHRAQAASRPSSLFRLGYYWLDYVLGYWFYIRRRCIAGNVYIFDRYFYDFIVDPRRSRIKLPIWLRSLFLKLTPEPDWVFFLDTDAATIHNRKQELSLDEIGRQLHAYRDLANRSRRFIRLDASRAPEVLCDQAIRSIIEQSFPRTQSKS